MFIWGFVAGMMLGQIIGQIYDRIVGLLDDFFMQIGNTRTDLSATSWVRSIVLFFPYLAWILYVTGLMVTMSECGIDYQTGRGSVKEAALNVTKGFLAVSLFTTAPVELYKLYVSLQDSSTAGITGLGDDFGTVATDIVNSLKSAGTWETTAASGVFDGLANIISPVLMIFILTLMGYAIVKVFFTNLKRGGVSLIQIAVGSLYMFSVPHGYIDGFVNQSKQIIGLCLTAFLQATVLVAGLTVVKDQAFLGLGLMLSAGEIPHIVGQFGLDTTTRVNVMGAVYAAQGAIDLTRITVQAVAK